MIRISALLCAISAATAMTAAAAQAPLVVSASTDSTVVTMGSQFRMTVEVTAASDSVRLVNAPEITHPDEGFGEYFGAYVVGIESDTAVAGDRRKVTNVYTLQAFDPTPLMAFPPIGAVAAGSADTAWAQMQTLKVLPVEVDTVSMALMPLAGAVSGGSRWHDYIPLWIWWVLLGVALAAAAVAAWSFTRKRKEVAMAEASKPVPPYELAIGRLSALRRSVGSVPGNEKHFYTELTDILRQYLHGRFGINALEMTSGQIVRALRNNPETRLPSEQVDAVLRIADFVKFAKEKPLADDNQRALQRATDFVETTRPAPEPEQPNPDKKSPSA